MLSHAKQIIHSSDTALNLLALHFMNHGEDMPEAEMENVLTAWRNNPNTVLVSMDGYLLVCVCRVPVCLPHK